MRLRVTAFIAAMLMLLPLFCITSAAPDADVTPVLSAGSYHTLSLEPDGTLYAWGQNTYGQVGDGTTDAASVPTAVMHDVVSVAAGRWSSYAVTRDGELYAWGSGEQGQLGLGDVKNRRTPTLVMGGVKQTASALNRAYALTDDGSVYAWGNASWAYPDGEKLTRTPRVVATDVDGVMCGGATTLLLRGGVLYALGTAAQGSVTAGVASEVRVASKVVTAAATGDEILYIDESGRLVRYRSGATNVMMTGMRAVAASGGRFAAVDNRGTMYVWGTNANGELGLGHYNAVSSPTAVLHNVDRVFFGGDYAVARKQNGELWVSGSNRRYQLGTGCDRLNYNAFHRMRAGEYEYGQRSSGNYRVLLDGRQMTFDVPPLERNDRLLVPMRAIFEALGAAVDWDEATLTASAERDGTTVAVTIGSSAAQVNGETVMLDAAAEQVGWRTLVPLRFVATALGAEVDYFADERLCEIKSGAAAAEISPGLLESQSASISVELHGGAQGSASGVVVGANGYILTNRHVVEDAMSISVRVGGRDYTASVVSMSQSDDAALIRIDATGLNAAEFSSTTPAEGDTLTVYDGMTGRRVQAAVTLAGYGGNSLLIDAALQPGASGSGVYDSRGRLCGIVWASAGEHRAAVLPYAAFAAMISGV